MSHWLPFLIWRCTGRFYMLPVKLIYNDLTIIKESTQVFITTYSHLRMTIMSDWRRMGIAIWWHKWMSAMMHAADRLRDTRFREVWEMDALFIDTSLLTRRGRGFDFGFIDTGLMMIGIWDVIWWCDDVRWRWTWDDARLPRARMIWWMTGYDIITMMTLELMILAAHFTLKADLRQDWWLMRHL